MSKIKVAINGFGRIGRLTLRALLQNHPNLVEVVAINDLSDAQILAHLFTHDSAHGKFNGTVQYTANSLIINGKIVQLTAIKNPAELPWKDNGIDVVLECTGIFTDSAGAGKHLQAGAKHVIISAPAKDQVKTVVLGINDNLITAADSILSNASCTTNCLAPMVKVLDENFGIEEGIFTTVHAYTSDQQLQDAPHKDLRRARAAALNIVPTTTGAAKAVEEAMPHLKGKLTGIATRVPVITGSLTDFNCILKNTATKQQINEAFKKAATQQLNGILQYSTDPLVSTDIISSPYSCIFDSDMTIALGKMVKVVGWYDNESGYSNRLADLAAKLANLL